MDKLTGSFIVHEPAQLRRAKGSTPKPFVYDTNQIYHGRVVEIIRNGRKGVVRVRDSSGKGMGRAVLDPVDFGIEVSSFPQHLHLTLFTFTLKEPNNSKSYMPRCVKYCEASDPPAPKAFHAMDGSNKANDMNAINAANTCSQAPDGASACNAQQTESQGQEEKKSDKIMENVSNLTNVEQQDWQWRKEATGIKVEWKDGFGPLTVNWTVLQCILKMGDTSNAAMSLLELQNMRDDSIINKKNAYQTDAVSDLCHSIAFAVCFDKQTSKDNSFRFILSKHGLGIYHLMQSMKTKFDNDGEMDVIRLFAQGYRCQESAASGPMENMANPSKLVAAAEMKPKIQAPEEPQEAPQRPQEAQGAVGSEAGAEDNEVEDETEENKFDSNGGTDIDVMESVFGCSDRLTHLSKGIEKMFDGLEDTQFSFGIDDESDDFTNAFDAANSGQISFATVEKEFAVENWKQVLKKESSLRYLQQSGYKVEIDESNKENGLVIVKK